MADADLIAINYSRDAGWGGGLIAEICRDADSTAVVTFNYDRRPEIGVYRTSLPDDLFHQAAREVRRSGYERLPIPGEAAPETKFVTIGERRRGEALPVLRPFDLRSVPPEVTALGGEIEKIVGQIRRHPSRVIRGTASWTKPIFDPGEPLALRLALESVGVLPVTIGNPLGAPGGSWNGVRLFLRDDTGKEQNVSFETAHLRAPPGAPREALAILAPGDVLAFDVKKKVYLAPGVFLGRLSYQNAIDLPDDPQFVPGELSLDLGRVTVARAGSGA